MRVKFCGITDIDDAAEAVRLGAWAIGMIHWAPSPRDVDPAVAAEIASAFRRKAEIVGVFVNPTLSEVTRAVENEQLSMVQLNGAEGASFCAEVGRRTGVKVVKAIHVASAADVHAAEAYRWVDYHLFDRRARNLPGGTGESFDWELLRDHRSEVPAILAGGLRPDNVATAVEIVRPYAVDVASGVEAEPGRKDHAKMAAFFEAANSVGAAT
ncbi:MAG: phosphoribosylanthranilate isomerase [Actinobacteria bacterium]|nr:phosphoribosylanthranilate isomerase [Actinomycetota bacterium]